MGHHNETHTAIIQEAVSEPYSDETASLIEINGTIVFIILSFAVFAVMMQRFFYRPLTEIREQRNQHIADLKNEGEEAFNKAEELSREYEDKIRDARKQVFDYTTAALTNANEEKLAILEERKKQVAVFLSTSRRQIHEEKLYSLESLRKKVDNYAGEIFKKVLEEEIAVIVGENNE